MLLCTLAVLAYGKDNLLHGLLVDVVVAHEHLLVACIAVGVGGGRKCVFAAVDEFVAIADGLFIVLDGTVGIYGGVQRQPCVQCHGGAAVGTSEVRLVVKLAESCQLPFNVGKLGVEPVV